LLENVVDAPWEFVIFLFAQPRPILVIQYGIKAEFDNCRSVGRSTCPQCGHSFSGTGMPHAIQTILGVLAALALALIMIPLAITAWKSCADILQMTNHAPFFSILWKTGRIY